MKQNTDSAGASPAPRQATRCVEKVTGEGSWGAFHMRQCSRTGKVQRNGRWYCTVHDPVSRKEKLVAAMEENRAKWDERRRIEDRKTACVNALEGVQNPAAVKQLIEAARRMKDWYSKSQDFKPPYLPTIIEALAALDTPVTATEEEIS